MYSCRMTKCTWPALFRLLLHMVDLKVRLASRGITRFGISAGGRGKDDKHEFWKHLDSEWFKLRYIHLDPMVLEVFSKIRFSNIIVIAKPSAKLRSIFMGIEHEAIHLETSSVLFRETPIHLMQVWTRRDFVICSWMTWPMEHDVDVELWWERVESTEYSAEWTARWVPLSFSLLHLSQDFQLWVVPCCSNQWFRNISHVFLNPV